MSNFVPMAHCNTSRDYSRLAELAKHVSVVCIVDHQKCRDVARAIFRMYHDEGYWNVSARGIGYVTAFDLDDFLRQCRATNLEFIELAGE